MNNLEYWPIFIIMSIAWLVPLVLSRLEISKVPSVIVEILMGVLVGPFVLGWIEETPITSFLAQTGFLFLIFLAGMEIDVNKIISSFPRGKIRSVDLLSNSLLVALFIYFGSLLLSLPFAWLMGQFIEVDLMFYTFLLPTVALSITVPILKAEGEFKRKFGQILLMEGAIATVMSIILISVYSGILKKGFQVELLLFAVIFIVFIVVYWLGKRLMKVRSFQQLLYRLEHAASQIRVRGAVALLFFFVVIAHLIGTELAMGAFFAGTLLSLFVVKERSALLFKLDGMSYGFFIPIFFIMVGVNLDISALTQFQESIPFILLLIAGVFITQLIPSFILIKVFGFRKALAGGILLTARMGLMIAAAQIGLSLGVISTADNAGIVTVAILISLISPLLYKMFNNIKEQHHNIYILGGSKASLYLAERLKMHDMSFITILQKRDILPEFDRKSLNYKHVECLNVEVISKIKLRTADLVIVLTESNNLNNELTHYIKNDLQHSKIITRKQSATHDLIDPHGEIKFVDHDEILANHIENMIASPDSVASLSQSFGGYRLEEIMISRTDINRKLVKEVPFPPSGSLVIQKRDGEVFIPHGNTHLLLGDIMTVIGSHAALAEFRNILEK
ncbi:cation:proton antiporter [uncultured Roseivirga sp.]|uniref:cation:proton antiporter domain-containing protein n=1 Tax=uncultured Roseivirga sp. TaxID=543088 RepID=UPI0030DB4C9A|tara:strand:- start:5129 stop:6988 length:1860 start_codon:yes stop_codon:yes gene_type:complete